MSTRSSLQATRRSRAGYRYPELIAVKAHTGTMILVEGHTRATAYVLAGIQVVDAFVGSSSLMHEWAPY